MQLSLNFMFYPNVERAKPKLQRTKCVIYTLGSTLYRVRRYLFDELCTREPEIFRCKYKLHGDLYTLYIFFSMFLFRSLSRTIY